AASRPSCLAFFADLTPAGRLLPERPDADSLRGGTDICGAVLLIGGLPSFFVAFQFYRAPHCRLEGAMVNPFVHVELATNDLDKAKTFYQSLFDWKLNDMDMGGGRSYTMIEVGEGTGGGMMKHPMANAPSAWLAYVNVDNAMSRQQPPEQSRWARQSFAR